MPLWELSAGQEWQLTSTHLVRQSKWPSLISRKATTSCRRRQQRHKRCMLRKAHVENKALTKWKSFQVPSQNQLSGKPMEKHCLNLHNTFECSLVRFQLNREDALMQCLYCIIWLQWDSLGSDRKGLMGSKGLIILFTNARTLSSVSDNPLLLLQAMRRMHDSLSLCVRMRQAKFYAAWAVLWECILNCLLKAGKSPVQILKEGLVWKHEQRKM